MADAEVTVHEAAAANRRDDVQELHAELQRRHSLLSELYTKRDALQRRLHVAQQDLEMFSQWLARAEDERAGLAAQLESERNRVPTLREWWRRWRRKKAGGARTSHAAAPVPSVPAARFTYFLYTSPFRVYREPTFTLRGWCWPESGEPVTALRARVDAEAFFGTYGLEEPEVVARHGVPAHNPRPGFKIVIATPAGRHRLSLEACVAGGDWVSFLTTPIWGQPTP